MNSAIMMLEETVKKYGEKTAVSDEHTSITFNSLRAKAISAASGLLRADQGEAGLKPVIVYLPKSVESIVCFTGAMYSGNPYVPVDSAIPMKRLQSIIDNMKSGHIITNGELRENLKELELKGVKLHLYDELISSAPDEKAVMDKVAQVIDSDPIYIMYTSGSTGVPKGVTIPHRGIIDYAEWLRSTFDFDENTVLGNQSAFYFDNSTLDIFTMLYTGAKMIIIPEVLFRFPAKLPEYLVEHSINTIFWVPTVMISVANSGILETCKMPGLKKVLFCGEAMPNRQLNVWRKYHPDKLYANLYGPTEITDVCTYYIVDREFSDTDPLPIGRACKNMRAIVLTEDNRQAKTDETGELCILGSALARGYWNAPEITRKVFVQNPLCTEYDDRMYRTGDLAFINSDGLIIFIGRADSQIKLRGNRIELGEIETAVKSIKEIGNACVIFDSEKEEIVLFAETECELQLRKLNMELKKMIPAYMLPGRLVCMKALPQTPNGKIDRVLLKSTL
jgi:D-alanine--poly(phosphoribitol) ligase subunit 1